MTFRFALGALLLGWAGVAAAADQPSYSPAQKTIAALKPYAGTFQVSVTSPADPSRALERALAQGGVTATLKVEVTDSPEGSTAEACEALVTWSPASQLFTAVNQTQQFAVTVTAPASAPDGDCVYRISTQGSAGGWSSGGGTTLIVSLSTPTPTDLTPPAVTITAPPDGASFTFCAGGTPVAFSFEAVEDMSPITAASATVGAVSQSVALQGIGTTAITGSGTFTAPGIGSHGLTATATSAGGTGDRTHGFSVDYDIGWLPPLSLGKTAKGGSTIPIKFTVRDCNGSFVHDETVAVAVYETSASGMPIALGGVFGEGSSSVRIDDVAGQYIVNFPTSPGAHTYRIEVSFAGENGALGFNGAFGVKQKELTVTVR